MCVCVGVCVGVGVGVGVGVCMRCSEQENIKVAYNTIVASMKH